MNNGHVACNIGARSSFTVNTESGSFNISAPGGLFINYDGDLGKNSDIDIKDVAKNLANELIDRMDAIKSQRPSQPQPMPVPQPIPQPIPYIPAPQAQVQQAQVSPAVIEKLNQKIDANQENINSIGKGFDNFRNEIISMISTATQQLATTITAQVLEAIKQDANKKASKS